MPTPSEHKTVQARILENAEAISFIIVSCREWSCWNYEVLDSFN